MAIGRAMTASLAPMVLAAMGAAVSAIAAERTLTLRNNALSAIVELRVTPSYAQAWGDDRLGGVAVAAFAERFITLEAAGERCYFDIRVVDADGGRRDYANVDLCSSHFVDYP